MRLALALLLIAAVARADIAQAPPPILATLSERLPNGLTLVVHDDPSVSSVAVVLRYDLGPDDAAHTGYAHLVEKLASQGTVHTKPGEFDHRIDEAGGFTTSSADADGIRFTTQVPSGALELAVFLEAERMAGLADGFSDAGLAAARDQIEAEYRAAYVDEPYALVEREVDHALWGTTRDVLVDRPTLSRISRADIRVYIRERLVPMNATLAIAGHVDAAQALSLARKYFAWIPPGKRIVRPSTPVVPLAAPVATTANDPNGRDVVAYRLDKRGAENELAVEVAARLIAQSLAKRATPSDAKTAAPGDAKTATASDKKSAAASDVRYEITHSSSGGELRFVSSSPLNAADIEQAIESSLTNDAVRGAAADLSLDTLLALEGLAYRADALASGMDYERRLAVLETIAPDTVKRAAAYWLAKSAAVMVTASANASSSAGGTP